MVLELIRDKRLVWLVLGSFYYREGNEPQLLVASPDKGILLYFTSLRVLFKSQTRVTRENLMEVNSIPGCVVCAP